MNEDEAVERLYGQWAKSGTDSFTLMTRTRERAHEIRDRTIALVRARHGDDAAEDAAERIANPDEGWVDRGRLDSGETEG